MSIVDRLNEMKAALVEQGARPPFTVRLTRDSWNEICAEVMPSMTVKRGGGSLQLVGMRVEIVDGAD